MKMTADNVADKGTGMDGHRTGTGKGKNNDSLTENVDRDRGLNNTTETGGQMCS